MDSSKRIQLLSNEEVDELYAKHEFNAHEQRHYFTLNPTERDALRQFSSTKTRIYLIMKLGYFKAKQQFFNFSLKDIKDDVQLIVGTYYSESAAMSLTGRLAHDYIHIQQ